MTTPTEHPVPAAGDAAREIALDEVALLDGPLYEIHDPDTGRVCAVRDTLPAAHDAAEQIAYVLAELTRRQLAANGEGHSDFWIRIHVRDQDTGQHNGGVGVALPRRSKRGDPSSAPDAPPSMPWRPGPDQAPSVTEKEQFKSGIAT